MQDLDMKRVMAKFTLWLLLPEWKESHAAVANDLIQTATNEPDFLKKVLTKMNQGSTHKPVIQKQSPNCPSGSCLVLQAQRRHGKVTAR